MIEPHDAWQQISRRSSNFRSKLKERLCAPVKYGYGVCTPVLTKADSKHNRKLTHYCQELEPDTDQYEHPVFIRCISEGLFWDLSTIGVTFYQLFNPLPRPAATLILTTVGFCYSAIGSPLTCFHMQFCIEEWQTGKHEPQDLNVNVQAKIFAAHPEALQVHGDAATIRLDQFQREWFSFSM